MTIPPITTTLPTTFMIMVQDAFVLTHLLIYQPSIILFHTPHPMINLTLLPILLSHQKIKPNPKNYLISVALAVQITSVIENQNLLANGITKIVHAWKGNSLTAKIITIRLYMKNFWGLLILSLRKSKKNIKKNKIRLWKFRKHPLKSKLLLHLQLLKILSRLSS